MDEATDHPLDVLTLVGVAVLLLGVLRWLVERCVDNVMGLWVV